MSGDLFGTADSSCASLWTRVLHCLTENACNCLRSPDVLARELFRSFEVESQKQMAKAAPAKRNNNRRRHRKLDEEGDLRGESPPETTSPTTSPGTAPPSPSPTLHLDDELRLQEQAAVCPAAATAVCSVVQEKDCCRRCQSLVNVFSACAVESVYPARTGLPFDCSFQSDGTKSASPFYECPGILSLEHFQSGNDSSSLSTTGRTFVGIAAAVLLLMLVCFCHAMWYHKNKKERIMSKPNRTKTTERGEAAWRWSTLTSKDYEADVADLRLSYAVSSMQGWRSAMEDRHLLVVIDDKSDPAAVTTAADTGSSPPPPPLRQQLPPHHALFGVLDGHGGTFAAQRVSQQLLPFLLRQEAFQLYCATLNNKNSSTDEEEGMGRGLLKQAMEEAFVDLEFDLLLASAEGASPKSPLDKIQPDAKDDDEEKGLPPSGTDDNLWEKNPGRWDWFGNGAKRRSQGEAGMDNHHRDNVRHTKASPSSVHGSRHHQHHYSSGTTVVVVLLTPKWIVCANLGDSRSVLFRGRAPADGACGSASSDRPPLEKSVAVIPLSDDHTLKDPAEQLRVEQLGGSAVKSTARYRIYGSLAVSRTLGDFEFKDYRPRTQAETGRDVAHRQVVSPVPDVSFHNLPDLMRYASDQKGPENRTTTETAKSSNELFLILACDGIWDVLSSENCARAVHERFVSLSASSAPEWVTKGEALQSEMQKQNNEVDDKTLAWVCESVIDQCLEMGSKDNMTLMIIKISSSSSAL